MQMILELILTNTDSKFLKAELDTFWVQKGGEDPVEWCRKMRGRLPLLHLKDYVVNLDREVLFGEVNPGGKLPLTFPRSVGQLQMIYNHKPSQYFHKYAFEKVTPLYPFGHGLSYSNFKNGRRYRNFSSRGSCVGKKKRVTR